MIYFCSNKNRRALVLQTEGLNGIDYLEVTRTGTDCGKQLSLTFLKDARSLSLDNAQVQITGGASSLAQVKVVSVLPATDAAPRVITVEVDKSGDFSTYTLALVAGAGIIDPPPGLDPQLSTLSFSFKAGCPTLADCLPNNCCPPRLSPEPDINYLAKDFGGFRQVMLDRMAVLAPAWRETHASDIGIALVELLAYAADHLSYQQDAVGTEAYIAKARSRISLRRHARLVDYKTDEGSNARTWLHVDVTQDAVFIPGGTVVYPYVPGFETAVVTGSAKAAALASRPLGFATMQDALLCQEQNCMDFYTWQDDNCCLPPGATQATLAGHLTTLHPGTVLIFEEKIGPQTGNREDADPNRRWAVRLTKVRNKDHLGNPLLDPVTVPLNPQPVTQIYWALEDALPFPLCLSSTTDVEHGSTDLTSVSVAYGNIIPVDHGVWQDHALLGWVSVADGSPIVTGAQTTFTSSLKVGQWIVFNIDAARTPYRIASIESDTSLTLAADFSGETSQAIASVLEDMGPVPPRPAAPVTESSCTCSSQAPPPPPRPRYFPELAHSPVTFAWPFDPLAPASQFMAPASTSIVASPGIQSQPIAGIVQVSNGSPMVTGTATSFTTAVSINDSLVFDLDPTRMAYLVQSVTSDTSLLLASDFAACVSGPTQASIIRPFPASSPTITTRALPQIRVLDNDGQVWTVLSDLLSTDDSQRVCTLEVEEDGAAFLRFGDGEYGVAVEPGMSFQTDYRVGHGSFGNIGRDSLAHIVTDSNTAKTIKAVRNPLPASGGTDRETMQHIRQLAPYAFRTQLRAVTEGDYALMAQKNSAVREARATLRWTGSWYTAFVSLDTAGDASPDKALLTQTKSNLNLVRMMGVDLEVEGAIIVGLDIELNICVAPDYFQADVETALMQRFVAGNQCTGQLGILNPVNFTFGQTIYTSPFVAAAQSVEGVSSVALSVFQRMDDPSIDGAKQGYLTLNRLELARCDNDPNRLDHGKFVLHMDGGK